jgi:hypothetical protein
MAETIAVPIFYRMNEDRKIAGFGCYLDFLLPEVPLPNNSQYEAASNRLTQDVGWDTQRGDERANSILTFVGFCRFLSELRVFRTFCILILSEMRFCLYG